jgi:hypothetical protein
MSRARPPFNALAPATWETLKDMSARRQTNSIPEDFRQHEKDRSSGIVPRAVIQNEALSYHLLRPKQAGAADIPLVSEAYRCWSAVWKQTLEELDHVSSVPSDDFSRQDEVGAIFHEWECIGMTSYRWVDLSNPIYKDDSYFSVWPRECVDAVCAAGTRVCIGSNLTVAAPWRNANGASVKELLLALSVERFLQSDADALAGTMRNNRGMNSLGYRLGFEPLAHDIIHHGVNVDLVAFYRRSCKRAPLDANAETLVKSLLPSPGALPQ